jgi:hypothetical protein
MMFLSHVDYLYVRECRARCGRYVLREGESDDNKELSLLQTEVGDVTVGQNCISSDSILTISLCLMRLEFLIYVLPGRLKG